MSRIGKMPVAIPASVKVEVKDGKVSAEGPKGKLSMEMPKFTSAKLEDGKVVVERANDTSKARAMHGLGRSLLHNMVQGVAEGFVKKLEIHGVGFKAAVQGKTITMNLGYSHPVTYDFPDNVSVKVEENTKVTVEGPDKWAVGLVASELRAFYPPEPYKGKGVRYSDERIERKEGKTVQ
jgi:large subunit ribosomal protein L6